MRDLAQKVGTVVFLLYRVCLVALHTHDQSQSRISRESRQSPTSGFALPTTVTLVAWSSCVCSLPGGQAFQMPDISIAVPVDNLGEDAIGSDSYNNMVRESVDRRLKGARTPRPAPASKSLAMARLSSHLRFPQKQTAFACGLIEQSH